VANLFAIKTGLKSQLRWGVVVANLFAIKSGMKSQLRWGVVVANLFALKTGLKSQLVIPAEAGIQLIEILDSECWVSTVGVDLCLSTLDKGQTHRTELTFQD
jgi:hypothetical protein